MKMMNLVSGSSGNSTLVGTENVTLLCDIGVSKRKIEECLNTADYTGRDIDALFITHEHIDHIRGLGVFSRTFGIPIYATTGTIEAIKKYSSLGKIDISLFHPIHPGKEIRLKDLTIKCHKVSHDAAEPVCYSFVSGEKKCCIATDLGYFTEELVWGLSECDVMLVEANHDIHMLEVGPYPYPLKQRILSDKGHLSNEAGGAFIRQLMNDHVKEIRLGHLSKDNNFPELALATVRHELLGNMYVPDSSEINIKVAARDDADPMLEF
jgi:phosphoribosyl 1,2-cyclic phosphodiesterase